MPDNKQKMTMHDRVAAVLQGEKPDRLPFIDRMEIWYKSKCLDNTIPEKYSGIEPYLTQHLIKEETDYRTAEYIIEHAEIVPRFEKILEDEYDLGDNGFVIPCLHRIPFQQALLEYLGEIPLFTALYESPRELDRLINLLDQQLKEILHRLSDLPSIYVEFGDNLDGMMTNPKLFEKLSASVIGIK